MRRKKYCVYFATSYTEDAIVYLKTCIIGRYQPVTVGESGHIAIEWKTASTLL